MTKLLTKSILIFLLITNILVLNAQDFSDKEPIFGSEKETKKVEKIKISTKWEKSYAIKNEVIHLAVIIELADKHHINPPTKLMIPTDDPFLVPTEIKLTNVSKGIVALSTIHPKPHKIQVSYDSSKPKEDINVYEGKTIFYIPFKFTSVIASDTVTINFDISYQICDDRVCYRPEDRSIEVSLNFKPNESLPGNITDELFKNIPTLIKVETKPLTSMSFIILVISAIFGGLLLNFTPCVLPVIPLKVMSLSNHSDSKKRSLLLGFSMVTGIIIFWVVIGGMIIGVKSFSSVSELFQKSYFTIGIGIFIAIMAVGMCGLFTLNVPQSVARFNPSFDSISGSFGIGIMTAILSTPCTAPFMGTAIAGAIKQAPIVVILVFFSVGFGMSLPYGILAVYPKLVSWLPKSGPSSVAIKQTMGIFMLAAAAFFIGIGLFTLGIPANKEHYYWWPTMLICAGGGIAIILFTLKVKPAKLIKSILLILGLTISLISIALAFELTKKGPLDWKLYTPTLLQTVKDQKNPIIIDFTAVYCLNCKVLEKSILESKAVVKSIKDNNVQLIKVDISDNDDEKIEFLKKSGSMTIPYLIIIDRNGKTIFKSNFYSKKDVIDSIKK